MSMRKTCSLQQIFENSPLHGESPSTLIDQSLSSWNNQIKHSSSFTEIFGELCFNEPQSSSPFSELINHVNPIHINEPFEKNNSLPNKKYSSLSLESLCYYETSEEFEDEEEEECVEKDSGLEENWLCKNSKTNVVNEYPPPISCIGRSGKPCVSFMSYRDNGRFILKQIPKQDFLHAHREHGRLTLQFVQHNVEDQDFLEEEDCDSGVESNIDEEENRD